MLSARDCPSNRSKRDTCKVRQADPQTSQTDIVAAAEAMAELVIPAGEGEGPVDCLSAEAAARIIAGAGRSAQGTALLSVEGNFSASFASIHCRFQSPSKKTEVKDSCI